MNSRQAGSSPARVVGAMALVAAAVAWFAWLKLDAIEADTWVLFATPVGLVAGVAIGLALAKRPAEHRSSAKPALSTAAAAGLGIFIAQAFPEGALLIVFAGLGLALGLGSVRAITLWRRGY